MPEGCDVSEHQGILPASFFAAYDFVILRAFNENGFSDRVFAQNWDTARGQTRRGVYGWPIPGEDNRTLGRRLVATALDAEAGYWADVERSGRGLASADDTEAYLRGIEDLDGKAGFYSNIGELPRSPFLDAHDWWVANYSVNDGTRHPINAPRDWVIHQYTSNPIDKNYSPDLAWLGASGDDDLNQLEQEMLKDVWDRTKDMRDGVPAYGVPPWHDITAAIKAIEDKVDALAGGTGDGLTKADVRAVVRDELNKTKLVG